MITAPLEQPTVDESNLNTFDNTRLNIGNMSASNKRGVITGTIVNNEVQPTNEETPVAPDTQETTEAEEEAEDTREELESSPFTQEFERTFGIKPNDAVELVNSLQAFRDEQTLMRQWSVDPVTYDSRMGQVREFYNTLPEDGRQQFNTLEGAVAIWNHLVELGKAKVDNPQQRTTSTNRVRKAPAKPTYDFTRTQITQMPREEYQRKLPAIVKAFQTGRVLDD